MEGLKVTVLGGILLGLVVIVVREVGADRLRARRLQLALGVLPGLFGAVLVLAPRFDLVSDWVEVVALAVVALLFLVALSRMQLRASGRRRLRARSSSLDRR